MKYKINSNCVYLHGYCNNNGYLDNVSFTNVRDFWGKIDHFFYFLMTGVILNNVIQLNKFLLN